MTDYLALGICLILSFAWIGWTAGLIYALRHAERDAQER